MIEFIIANKTLFLGAGLALSELLAVMPFIKSNSIGQLIVNGVNGILKKLAGK